VHGLALVAECANPASASQELNAARARLVTHFPTEQQLAEPPMPALRVPDGHAPRHRNETGMAATFDEWYSRAEFGYFACSHWHNLITRVLPCHCAAESVRCCCATGLAVSPHGTRVAGDWPGHCMIRASPV
jgi:hypothetical protein